MQESDLQYLQFGFFESKHFSREQKYFTFTNTPSSDSRAAFILDCVITLSHKTGPQMRTTSHFLQVQPCRSAYFVGKWISQKISSPQKKRWIWISKRKLSSWALPSGSFFLLCKMRMKQMWKKKKKEEIYLHGKKIIAIFLAKNNHHGIY